MAKKVLIAVGAVLGLLVVIIATRPAAFVIERTITVDAPPEVAYAQVIDFHRWDGWSPWAKLDPNQKTTHSGAASGVGAKYEWAGNDQVGEGNMIINEAQAPQMITIALNFLKPFEAHNTTRFTFVPQAKGTTVSWVMAGERGFMEKAFSLVMDMDKMVGPDFEKGLAGIKQIAEKEASEQAAAKAAAEAAAAAAAAAPAAGDAGTP